MYPMHFSNERDAFGYLGLTQMVKKNYHLGMTWIAKSMILRRSFCYISWDLVQDFNWTKPYLRWLFVNLFFFFGLILQQVAISIKRGFKMYIQWHIKKNAASYKFLLRAASMAFWFEVVKITVLTKIDGVPEKTKSSGFMLYKEQVITPTTLGSRQTVQHLRRIPEVRSYRDEFIWHNMALSSLQQHNGSLFNLCSLNSRGALTK